MWIIGFCVNQLEFGCVCVCDFTSRASVVSLVLLVLALACSFTESATLNDGPTNNQRNQKKRKKKKKKENRLRTVSDARMGVAVIQCLCARYSAFISLCVCNIANEQTRHTVFHLLNARTSRAQRFKYCQSVRFLNFTREEV